MVRRGGVSDAGSHEFSSICQSTTKVFNTIAKSGEKVVVEKDGVLFRVEPEEKPQDIWAHYDPEQVREGLRKSAGALSGVDIEALKRDIREQQGQDRPA